MLLNQITRGKVESPHFILAYGPDGVGKSTLAAHAPDPVFIPVEKGTNNLDVARFPTPKSYADVRNALIQLRDEKHNFKTVVVDTADHLEALIWRAVCEADPKSEGSIEKVGGGYGKGYTEALRTWREFGELCLDLWNKGINVILLAHSEVKAFNDPYTPQAYDRYQVKVNAKAAAYLRELVEVVLFCNFQTLTTEKDKKRGISDGTRVMFTERRASFDAKNRVGLPFELALSWEAYVEALENGGPAKPSELKKQITELLKAVTDEKLVKTVTEKVKTAKSDAVKLAIIKNRLVEITASK